MAKRTDLPRPSLVLAIELDGPVAPDMPGAPDLMGPSSRRVLEIDEVGEILERKATCIGNQIFRVAPIKPNGSLVFWEVLDVVHSQLAVLSRGIGLRGVLTMGMVGSAPAGLRGSGILEAERLRREVADYPRVVVDPAVFRAVENDENLRANHHTPLEELAYIQSLVTMDSDGMWFIDYLRAGEGEADDPGDFFALLASHADIVSRDLDAADRARAMPRGACWRWAYHNAVLDDLLQNGKVTAKEHRSLSVAARQRWTYRFPAPVKKSTP